MICELSKKGQRRERRGSKNVWWSAPRMARRRGVSSKNKNKPRGNSHKGNGDFVGRGRRKAIKILERGGGGSLAPGGEISRTREARRTVVEVPLKTKKREEGEVRKVKDRKSYN